MIQNTYIASFAYNLFLCWLGHHRNGAEIAPIDSLLAHNFKKFFAEQIYRQTNRIPSRALLLETLLYEQAMMVDVFALKEREAKLSADADAAAGLMSFALSMHELGHYYLATQPATWAALIEYAQGAIGPLYERAMRQRGPEFAVEFQCDAYAVVGCFRQYEAHAGPAFALRAITFAFAAYAAMYSAAATAAATARLWDAGPAEQVDFLDIAPMPDVEHDTEWAFDAPFLARAGLVGELCAALATARGMALYGDDDPFPLPSTIVKDLTGYVGKVFDCADVNARRMSNLVAQAMTGHDQGMEYLYLRRPTFRFYFPVSNSAGFETRPSAPAWAPARVMSPVTMRPSRLALSSAMSIALPATDSGVTTHVGSQLISAAMVRGLRLIVTVGL
jgi:hypothetical protein